jgi:hypothetical protein
VILILNYYEQEPTFHPNNSSGNRKAIGVHRSEQRSVKRDSRYIRIERPKKEKRRPKPSHESFVGELSIGDITGIVAFVGELSIGDITGIVVGIICGDNGFFVVGVKVGATDNIVQYCNGMFDS